MPKARSLILWVVAISLATLFVRLGFWQLDRRAQRRAIVGAIETRAALPALDWTGDGTVVPADTTGLLWRRVRARGRYDPNREIILRGRSRGGRPGVEVLTPLRIGERALLVLRGWLPAADGLRADLAAGWPAGWMDTASVTVEGLLLPPRPGRGGEPLAVESAGRTHLAIAGADIELIARELPWEVAPFVLLASSEGTGAPGLGPPPEIDRGEGPHLSYAIQWFSFAAISLVGTGLLLRKERG